MTTPDGSMTPQGGGNDDHWYTRKIGTNDRQARRNAEMNRPQQSSSGEEVGRDGLTRSERIYTRNLRGSGQREEATRLTRQYKEQRRGQAARAEAQARGYEGEYTQSRGEGLYQRVTGASDAEVAGMDNVEMGQELVRDYGLGREELEAGGILRPDMDHETWTAILSP